MHETESVRKVIEEHNSNLMAWYASGQIDRVVEVFAEDCWQMPPNAEPMVGREALRAGWKQAVKWGNWNFTFETQDVVLSGNVAVERGKYKMTITAGPEAPPNFEVYEDHGNYVVFWRLEEDNQWRIVWDAPVSERPLAS